MKIISSKQEFEEFYPYDRKYINNYPKSYPCVCKWEYEDRGIMGDERVVYVAYFPKVSTTVEAFYIGLGYNWERIS